MKLQNGRNRVSIYNWFLSRLYGFYSHINPLRIIERQHQEQDQTLDKKHDTKNNVKRQNTLIELTLSTIETPGPTYLLV